MVSHTTCSYNHMVSLPQLYRSTYLLVTRGGFLLHCCKVPTSIWKILPQLGRSAFWTNNGKISFQRVPDPFHSYFMGNYSNLHS